jgi:hypothetical protein
VYIIIVLAIDIYRRRKGLEEKLVGRRINAVWELGPIDGGKI